MKRALDALKDFRIDVELGEETVRVVNPVQLDPNRKLPPQTIRLRDVRLKSGDFVSSMDVNLENDDHVSEAAVRGMAVQHMAEWLDAKLKGKPDA